MSVLAEIREILVDIEPIEGKVWRTGWVPNKAEFPYASILDPVSEVPELEGDGRGLATRRTFQVDLWQTEEAEDDTLPDQVFAALDGTKTSGGYRLRVVLSTLVPEDDDIVHHAITGDLVRLR
jgi:hypothetical protein